MMTSSVGGSPPTGGDLERFLGLLEKDKCLAQKRLDPLCVFLLAGASVETMKRVYNTNPKSLDADLIVEACRQGAGKDVVLFLVQKWGRKLETKHFLSACQYVKNRPGVLEILRNSTDADFYAILPPRNRRQSFSRNSPYASPVELDYISRVGMMLPVVKHLNIQDENKWEEEAIFSLVKSVLSSKKLLSIDITFPRHSVRQDPAGRSKGLFALADSLSNCCCGVEKLRMDLPSRQSNLNQALLIGLLHLPRLEELTIFYQDDRIKEVLPLLGRLVRRSIQLKSLSIQPQFEWTSCCHGSPKYSTVLFPALEDAKACYPILDALKQNVHLKSLVIGAFAANKVFPIKDEMEDKLGPILQHDNTTLTTFTLGFVQNVNGCAQYAALVPQYEYKMRDHESDGSLGKEFNRNWDYYIALNKAGRALVRNFDQENNLTIARFVDLLAIVEESVRLQDSSGVHVRAIRKARAAQNATKIQYGLLREMPGLWSNFAAPKKAVGRFCGHKRKHTAEANGE